MSFFTSITAHSPAPTISPDGGGNLEDCVLFMIFYFLKSFFQFIIFRSPLSITSGSYFPFRRGGEIEGAF